MVQPQPIDTPEYPDIAEFVAALGYGVIAHPERIVAAVEAYPGPAPDWRARLVTEAMAGAGEIMRAGRGERAVVVGQSATANDIRRYRRQGWRVYRFDDLLQHSFGEARFQRLTRTHTPKKRQARLGAMLADLSAPRAAVWPVMRVLDNFYKSAAVRPGKAHKAGRGKLDEQAVEWAAMLWEQQLADPIGSGLGLSREAAIKYWQVTGAAWPDMAPDLPPRLLVIPQAEDFAPAELEILLAQACPAFCFCDPAVGVRGATPASLQTLPLGSRQFERHGAALFSMEGALRSTIDKAIRNDIEMPDRWVLCLAALSGVALGRHRKGFDAYRAKLSVADESPRMPPLAPERAMPHAVISRTGVATLEYLLEAIKPGIDRQARPRLKFEMDRDWAALIRDAYEVAQVMRCPLDQWDSRLRQRYRAGRAEALTSMERHPLKGALIALFRRREDLPVYPLLKSLAGIEYRGERVIHSGGIKDASLADGSEGRLWLGSHSRLESLPSNAVLHVDDEPEEGTGGSARAVQLYRVLSQRPVRLSQDAHNACEFIERSLHWLDVKLTPPADARVSEAGQSRPVPVTPSQTDMGTAGDRANDPVRQDAGDAPDAGGRPSLIDDPEMEQLAVAEQEYERHQLLEREASQAGRSPVAPQGDAAFMPSDASKVEPSRPDPDALPPALREGFADQVHWEEADAGYSKAADAGAETALALSESMLDEAAAHEARLSDMSYENIQEAWGDWASQGVEHSPVPSPAAPPAEAPALEEEQGLGQAWASAVHGIHERSRSRAGVRRSGPLPAP